MRADVLDDSVSSVRPAPTSWALGTSLAERAGAATSSAHDERTRIRSQRWRAAHGLAANGQLTRLLAASALDEAALSRLLGEDPDRLAARLTPPDWAHRVAEVLSTAPADPPPIPDDARWPEAFGAIVRPFATHAAAALTGDLPGVDIRSTAATFAVRLERTLLGLAARVLVLELNVARVRGRLAGATAADRFCSFVRQCQRRDGLAALLAEYPVLARLLATTAAGAAAAATECLHRFTADRAELIARVLGGTEPGPLIELITAGDPHHGGRSVTVLRFARGAKVVYKPRPVAGHRHVNELVDWLSTMSGLDLATLAVLDRGGWGWVEHVTRRDLATVEQASTFYRRQGTLLALLYLLDGTDQHAENLVARGDQPLLVDLETLFHPDLSADPDPAARFLRSSVHRAALLPTVVSGTNGAFDVSGAGGLSGGTLPFDITGFAAESTDAMRVVRRPATAPGWHNRPRFARVELDPKDYLAELLDGFRAAYDTLAAHRPELSGLLQRFRADQIRVVVRHTALYTRLLDESTHPDVLRDALDRDRELAYLWAVSDGDPQRERLVRHELADLWAGDIPVFSTTPDGLDLVAADGTVIPGVLAEAGLDRVRRKLSGLSPTDRGRQEWIIRAAFAGVTIPSVAPASVDPVEPDADRLVAAAQGIAAALSACAHRDRHRINWLGLECVDQSHRTWAVAPLGASLSSGYPGVALFLAQLAAVTGDAAPAELASLAIRPIPDVLDRLAGQRVGSGFTGLGGLAYALASLGMLLDDREVLGWATTAVALIDDSVGGHDFLDGTAGCLAAMLAVHELTGSVAAWRIAENCAARLTEVSSEAPGFAHGRHGIGWALRRFTEAGGHRRFAERGVELLSGSGAAAETSWCNGIAGTTLATMDGFNTLLRTQPLGNYSLCHGELGVLEVLAMADDRVPEGPLRLRTGRLLAALERTGVRCGTPDAIATPGLLIGLAGIGHGLLRLGFPDRVPAVMVLNPLARHQDSEHRSEGRHGPDHPVEKTRTPDGRAA